MNNIRKNKKHSDKENIVTGVFSGNERGFGFVAIEGEDDDFFIPAKYTGSAFDGDTVQISVMPGSFGKRMEGRVVRVVERGAKEVVGVFKKNKKYGFVIPDNLKICHDIYVPEPRSKGAVSGHKVVTKITDYGGNGRKPEGIVTEILGHINEPGVDVLSVIKGYDIPTEYPDDVYNQAESIPGYVTEQEKQGRLDLRTLQTVTIDSEDAKDLDDAVTLSKNGDIYTLGVHIADVSHYVTEKSPIDKEAQRRGTSVYLVDRVIPMLPHKLSNGICSLNEGEDRLALSCIMDIDACGNVISHRIAETLINVDRRMTYTAVKKIIEDNDKDTADEYRDFVPMFMLMAELSGKLREQRHKRGSIDFDFPESKIILGKKGRVVDVMPYERNTAHKIIEDFMLLANETVAEEYFWQEIPFVYRTHDKPDGEKIKQFCMFINNFGLSIKAGRGEIHPKEIQKLLGKIEGRPEEALISRLALRAMKRAEYTTENTGHFGLSAQYYCHFTSPIRRYPDLQIHRIIKENLNGGLDEDRINHYERILLSVAQKCSLYERRADDAERNVEKIKKIEYIRSHIGEEFEGVISGMTSWGIYVELPNTIEGMVRVSSMDGDYFYYDEEHYEMAGETTGRRYRLGQKVNIVVMGADKLQKTIDFAF